MASDQEDIAKLMESHQDSVAKLRDSLGGSGEAGGYDDVWLLRFVLSHKDDLEAARKAAANAIAWREKNAKLLQCAKDETDAADYFKHIREYVASDFHDKDSKFGEPLFIVRSGISNPAEVMKKVTVQEMIDYLMYRREMMFIRADRRTRETGKLVKVISLNDFNHLSLFGFQDRKFMSALTQSSNLAEDMYPQLVGRACMINMPTLFTSLFSLMKTFLSKRTTDKIAMCPGHTLTGDIRKCPFVAARFNIEDVPTFLGGKCKCPRGCVAKVPNDQTHKIGAHGEDGSAEQVVGARDKHTEVLAVQKGDVVLYQLETVEHGIEFSVNLQLDNGEEKQLVQVVKVKQEKYEGSFNIDDSGTLTFLFDNSYSLLNSKTVKYSLNVMEGGMMGSLNENEK